MYFTRRHTWLLAPFTLFLALVVPQGAAAAPPPKTLEVSVQGAGSVTLDPPEGEYPRGTTVMMTAIPEPGWYLDHWEGPTIGGSTLNPQPITMYNNYSVVAVFDTPKGVDVIRKRDAVIQVVDAVGTPVPDVDISVNMTKRAFPFGVAVTNQLLANSEYRNFVRQNSPRFWDWAVFGNEAKWYTNEVAQGFVNYQDADAMVDMLQAWGFSLRGHTVFWAVPDNVQQWVQDLPYPTELQAAVDARLNDALSHFQGVFEHWDVNNEMVHGSFFEDRLPGIRKHMHDRTMELDPGALITINDYNVVAGGWDTDAFKDLVLDLEAQGVHIDLLGVQCHMSTDDTVEEINQRLDSVAELGYPIWITEFDVEASDPLVRAQAVEDFYRAAYGHPAVAGIMMWGFWAGDHWRGPDAALVDLDWTVNEAGQRYASLMDEWWTDETGLTDASGESIFNVFHGDYEVTLTPNGGSPEAHSVSVAPGSGAELMVLELGAGQPADLSAPVPDPVTWDVPPTPVDNNALSMLATTASDPSGVEYYFANLTDPSHDSGWLDTPFFTDIGVNEGVEYTYQVKTRDTSVNGNESTWSVTASATTVSDGNLLANGDFEYGYPDGWAGFGGASILVTDAVAASGQFSCFVGNRSDTWKGVEQDLLGKMVDGGTYDISAWFLLANSPSEPVALTVRQTDAAGTNYYSVATGTATDVTWSELSGTFTLNVTGTLTGLFLYTEGPAPGVELYVDDLWALETAAPSCGDASCNGTEDQCSCASDCGAPPTTETVCSDGTDDDCDGNTDCDDSDCSAAPECQSVCNDNGVCEAGEDCTNCGDCPGVQTGRPASRYCCGDGVADAAEGDGSLCDGNH